MFAMSLSGKLRPSYEGAGSIPGRDATIESIDLNLATLRKIG